jgi:hypothetical protein
MSAMKSGASPHRTLEGSKYQSFARTRLCDAHQGLHRPNTTPLQNHCSWATNMVSAAKADADGTARPTPRKA